MNPLSPEHVVFFIALVAGILFMVVNAVGGVAHGDADHDVGDADGDHDADHDVDDGLLGRALSAMGVGRVPLLLLLMIFLLLFGVSGVFLSLSRVGPWISHVGAFVIATSFTSFFARRLSRIMPTTESYNVSKEDLVGCTGTAVFAVTGSAGAVQVRDRAGDIFKISARTTQGERVEMGAGIVVVSYDDEGFYVVTNLK